MHYGATGAPHALTPILVTLFVDYGAWQVVSIWVDRTIAAEDRRRADEMGAEAFDTDLDMVRRLLKQTGRRMLEIDEIKDDFIQPFKAQGAVDVDDHGFIVQTKFMSKPGRQWTIRRHAFQALQEAFEENGIPWARPEIKVRVDRIDPGEGRDGALAKAAGAAAGYTEGAPEPAAE